jgi:hypothetical protein
MTASRRNNAMLSRVLFATSVIDAGNGFGNGGEGGKEFVGFVKKRCAFGQGNDTGFRYEFEPIARFVDYFEAGSDLRDELSLGAGTVRFSIIRTNEDSRAMHLFA